MDGGFYNSFFYSKYYKERLAYGGIIKKGKEEKKNLEEKS